MLAVAHLPTTCDQMEIGRGLHLSQWPRMPGDRETQTAISWMKSKNALTFAGGRRRDG
jgi:hypothetical protein